MKKVFFSLVAVFALAISLVSCSSNSPKASAEKFVNGLTHMDYEAAKSVSTEDTKKMLEMMQQLTAMMPDSVKENAKKAKVNIGKEEINGDKATVTYTTSENPTEQKLNLVKQNGKWLVQWSKNDNGAGAGSDMSTPPPTNDTMAASPVTIDSNTTAEPATDTMKH
jgi:GH25 family lysozyme M1 (1,4-beta-N-acetylmuramidase)